ncbi:hypothetical protein [Metamycoplasma alkalescens]|uniref:Uncharacterized protein n=2 Tax=Metamycoplasma alkalescens TaxID=45363 RepID=N9UAY9_9BACT|nr:hypothetical protein [Metamycoplasma alkalescens]ENY53836.1 Hypothetical protein MALK_4400 [Metamycoplasma alkalescens 14918]PYF43748.1 hypothetical protein BCF88_10166 [Metamycoplasma alkalescens]SYV90565.1 Uncharacterised protein [Metamycoplasma alkalescens]
MKLKYVLSSEINNQENEVIETEYVDFFEKEHGKFTHIEFTDNKTMNCVLDVSDDEIKINYANQELHMKKNYFIPNKLKISEGDFFEIDVYLIKVIISKELILFTYDLLQNKNIIVRNTAKLIFQN